MGNLVRFVLLPGQRFDTLGVAPLIDGLAIGGLIADKAFDSNYIADLNERGAKIVISQHPRRASVPFFCGCQRSSLLWPTCRRS
ncbi:transposase [Mesorhizobium amorphae CCBAU 01583]|nr:transposase [Mesorhizobium amorphae CCBAU 01583]